MNPAILMAAWRAERWIMEAVRSIRNQDMTVDLLIGVDGCEATSAELTRHEVPHYRSEQNVGPYVIRNSLSILARHASHYLIFDADDTMDTDYVRLLVEAAGDTGLSGCAHRRYRDGEGIVGVAPFHTGRPCISRSAWLALGGFRSWRVSSDTDLWWRARDLGLPLNVLTSAHMTALIHPDSQMAAPDTGLGSPMRSEIFAKIHAGLERGDLVVKHPETVELELAEEEVAHACVG